MEQEKHIAHRSRYFFAVSITPDFCKVGDKVVPFDIAQTLDQEYRSYTQQVFSESIPILLVDSIVRGVQGNAGQGIHSGVSLATGQSRILTGDEGVIIEDKCVAREGNLVDMNMSGERSNGTYGRLLTDKTEYSE